jgi:NAD(P)-dependent dehydrogenase (short-subunit alcohol dehydrogenase family)
LLPGAIAVVTGGGTGMGRELVMQLAATGARVAMCDVFADNMSETVALTAAATPGAQVISYVADVADADAMDRFAAAVASQLQTSHVNLLFNNAGIGGGSSFVLGDRPGWDKTFNVCWGGVYNGCRSFLPMLLKAQWGHVVNTSSINGIWGRLPNGPNNAYVAAKFAVRGFTESLVTDFALHAPHLRASVVHPGHIGTPIAYNSLKAHAPHVPSAIDQEIRERSDAYIDSAPMSAAEASKVIIDAVMAGDWRILVGDDAVEIDRRVRQDPDQAHTQSFVEHLQADGILTAFR